MTSSTSSGDILPIVDAEKLIDFTCASPWERFALDVELVLRGWKIDNGKPIAISPQLRANETIMRQPVPGFESKPIATSRITFANRIFWLELRSDPEGPTLDSAPLQRLLGISSCVLLAGHSGDDVVAEDGSDAAVLLSALTTAATSCSCTMPMIVPVGLPRYLRFIGRRVGNEKARFSCDSLTYLPDDCSHLAGLLKLFHNKRAASKRIAQPSTQDAMISAKFIYYWNDFSFKLNPTSGSFAADQHLSVIQTDVLQDYDPIRRITLSAVWNDFHAGDLRKTPKRAGMPVSTANFVKLTPPVQLVKQMETNSVPSVRIPMSLTARICVRLAIRCAEAQNFDQHASASLVDVPNIQFDELPPSESTSAGDANASNAVPRQNTETNARAALEDFLAQSRQFLAAAAVEDNSIDEEFISYALMTLFDTKARRGVLSDVVEALGPNGSELSTLERLGYLAASLNSVKAVKYLWGLFVDGLELHWKHRWHIAGVPRNSGQGPDLSENLVVQKLQMINSCMERTQSKPAASGTQADDAMGRKRKLEGISLIGDLDGKGEPETDVWEPYLQPLPYVTRDIVDEEQKQIINGERSHKKGQGVSKALLCDMMAFKAANPGASMSDFIRWFSPTDWIDEQDMADDKTKDRNIEEAETRQSSSMRSENGSASSAGMNISGETTGTPQKPEESGRRQSFGRLSGRMRKPGNEWEELWKSAEPLAASLQEPLFDASAHGAQALADLRTMPLIQVCLQLASIVASNAASLLHDAFEKPPKIQAVRKKVEKARQAARSVSNSLPLCFPTEPEGDSPLRIAKEQISALASVVDALIAAEYSALCATSLVVKLPPTEGFAEAINALIQGKSYTISNERDLRLLINMASLDDSGWRPALLPERREFILSGTDDSDRMYASLSSDEFRTAFHLGLQYML